MCSDAATPCANPENFMLRKHMFKFHVKCPEKNLSYILVNVNYST